ncbi:hypothetical protein OEA41_009685 [Lepraria neglecta]|uniref:Uncharacterized protein n=1 Tax=Lepraria neglecta TaxID=209136 RepID=A0AAD9Z418_9LECA|nr:hypothetical protein OEA41_009685 [Lepraria neglecta]
MPLVFIGFAKAISDQRDVKAEKAEDDSDPRSNTEGEDAEDYEKAVSENAISEDEKTLMVMASYRDEGLKKNEPDWALRSDMTIEGLRSMLEDVSDLKFIVRCNVVNQSTKMMLKAFHKEFWKGYGEHIEYVTSTSNLQMDNAFTTLAYTDNATGVFYMLADYRNEFQHLMVTKIYVFFLNT